MGRQTKKGVERRQAKAAARAALAAEFNLPASAVAPSQPNPLGRSMFLSKKDMKKFVTSGGKIPDYLIHKEQK